MSSKGKNKKSTSILFRFFDEIVCVYFGFRSKSSRLINLVSTIFRWTINYISPIAIGVLLEPIIRSINDSTFILSFGLINDNVLLIGLIFIYAIGFIWKVRKNYRDCSIKRIEDSIRGIFEDLQINGSLNLSDIRCTVWTPLNSKKDLKKMEIIQLIDYYPTISGSEFIQNYSRKGRVMKVARKREGKLVPIGVVGMCIFESLKSTSRATEPHAIIKNISRGYLKRFLRRQNFTEPEIKKLTPNRLSYACFPIMNHDKMDILALLYFDSSIKDELDRVFCSKIENYLPRIAKIMVD